MWLKKAIGLAGTAGQQIPNPSSLLATLAYSVHLFGVPLVCIIPVVVVIVDLLVVLLLLPVRGPGEVKVPGGTVAVPLSCWIQLPSHAPAISRTPASM